MTEGGMASRLNGIYMAINPTHYKASRALRLIAGILLLGALGTWPYAYYQILRWTVVIAGGYSAWILFSDKRIGWAWFFTAAAILFNPIAPIYMQKSDWYIFDVVIGMAFLISLYLVDRKDAK